MLRITTSESPDRLRLQLEGSLSGAWVAEVEDCWRSAAPALGGRELWVDLSGVDSIDCAGRYLLALLHKSGARFVAPGCMVGALVHDICTNW